MSRRRKAPQYGGGARREPPNLTVAHAKTELEATNEMAAFDRLPQGLQDYLRTSRIPWKSEKIIEYWNRLDQDTTATLNLLFSVESQFKDNQSPPNLVTVQIRRQ